MSGHCTSPEWLTLWRVSLIRPYTHQMNTAYIYALLIPEKKMFSKRIKEENMKAFERRLWKRDFDEKTILGSQKMSKPSE